MNWERLNKSFWTASDYIDNSENASSEASMYSCYTCLRYSTLLSFTVNGRASFKNYLGRWMGIDKLIKLTKPENWRSQIICKRLRRRMAQTILIERCLNAEATKRFLKWFILLNYPVKREIRRSFDFAVLRSWQKILHSLRKSCGLKFDDNLPNDYPMHYYTRRCRIKLVSGRTTFGWIHWLS